jgi:signal peptidase
MAEVALGSTRRPVLGALGQILRAAGVGLSVGILLVVIGLAGVLLVVPKVTESVPLTILTPSMEPTLPPGTLIVVRPIDTDTLQIGDVATYQIRSGDPAVITHRVLSIQSESDGTRTFVFKGDNNAEPDSKAVTAAQIQGIVWYSVPFVGYANQAMNGEARGWIIPAAAVALLAYATVTIISGAIQTGRTRRASAAADVEADAHSEHAQTMVEGVANAADADPSHPRRGEPSPGGRPGDRRPRGRHRR